MKNLSNEEWEKDLTHRFVNTDIRGNLLPNGNIGVNLSSIANVFIREFNNRHAELLSRLNRLEEAEKAIEKIWGIIGECGDVHGNKENRIERILLDYETTREDRK